MSTTDDSSLREAFAHWLSMVAARLESKAAKEVAATLTQAMSKQQRIGLLGVDRSELSELEKALSGVLLGLDRSEQRQRTASVVLSLGAGTGIQPPVATIPPLQPALEPLPCRFSDQELVDMLKWPLTVGQARRVILDQLEIRHKRKFADHWDFVHFATERRLGLDFTSPPKRP